MIDQQVVRDKFRAVLVAEMTLNQISIRKLARASGVSISAIVSYRNATRDVPMHKMMAMADAIGIDPKTLVPEL